MLLSGPTASLVGSVTAFSVNGPITISLFRAPVEGGGVLYLGTSSLFAYHFHLSTGGVQLLVPGRQIFMLVFSGLWGKGTDICEETIR